MNRFALSGFLLLLCFIVCPGLPDPNLAAKGYFFYFFTFCVLLGLIFFQGKLRVDSIILPLLVLVSILLISNLGTRAPAMGLVFVAFLLTAVGFFLLSRQLAFSLNGSSEWLMGGIALVSLLFGGFGLGQLVARKVLGPTAGMYIPYLLPKTWDWRVSGPFGQPNFHALMMVLGLCGLAYLFLSSNRRKISRLASWFYPLLAFLLLFNLYLTQSRAGNVALAGVIVGLIFWVRYWRRQGRIIPFSWRPPLCFCVLLVGALLLAQSLIAVSTSQALATRLKMSQETSIYSRINTWTAALLMGADHPLLGVGPDNFRIYLHPYQVQARDLMHFEYEDMVYTRWAHNEFLQVFAEGGALGLAAMLWFIFLAIKQIFLRLTSKDLPFEQVFLPLALLAMLLQSLLSWPLRFPPFTALFFCLLAFSIGSGGQDWTFSWKFKWLRGGLVCFLLLMIGVGCWSFYWDLQLGTLKSRVSIGSNLEENFLRFEELAGKPFTSIEALSKGTFPFFEYAVKNHDINLAQRLLPYLEKSIFLDGAYWQWYNLARLSLTAGEESGAMAAVNKSLELNPIFEPGWGFRHYLDVLLVSRKTGQPISELLPQQMLVQELFDDRYLPPPPQ